MATFVKGQPAKIARTVPWYRELSRYQWFVFIVASLGWMFDTMDQQLFNLARRPAIVDLMKVFPGDPAGAARVAQYSGYVTMIFMIGWASGGVLFGVLGDRIGRARTMIFTILLYATFTGLSVFSTSVWDFSFYRFLTGLGVGGQFSVGVAIVAETVSDRARPYALGWLQASQLSEICSPLSSAFSSASFRNPVRFRAHGASCLL
jgi:MFS family permease